MEKKGGEKNGQRGVMKKRVRKIKEEEEENQIFWSLKV